MKYEFVRCNSCSWHRDHVYGLEWGRSLAEHAETNCARMKGIMLPMWSVAWPWYHTPEPERKWGLEMEWRPVGTHSVRAPTPFDHGGMAKEWYLFPPLVALDEVLS